MIDKGYMAKDGKIKWRRRDLWEFVIGYAGYDDILTHWYVEDFRRNAAKKRTSRESTGAANGLEVARNQ